MFRRSYLRLSVFVAVSALALGSLALGAQQDNSRRGRKFKVPPPSSRIQVTVLRDINGKPIENAAVIFHPMEGERDKGVLELKTNDEGKAVIDVLPLGDTVRLQVIAKGFQTYGEDFKVDKLEITMQVRMKRPGEQYSIYKNTGETTPPAAKDDSQGKQNTKPNPAPQPQPK